MNCREGCGCGRVRSIFSVIGRRDNDTTQLYLFSISNVVTSASYSLVDAFTVLEGFESLRPYADLDGDGEADWIASNPIYGEEVAGVIPVFSGAGFLQ